MATRPPSPALSYTIRRDEPTRLEGFSDAVFGFSLTLLAFSLEVPSSIEELKLLAVAQLVPTMAAFALMCWIWAEHNSFFRQFGLQDSTTVVLNSMLLFLVVFYTYPLKFMAVYLWMIIADMFDWNGITSAIISSGSLDRGTHAGRGQDFWLMVIYNIGFITLFSLFALLYRHALRQKDALQLDELELFEARNGLRVMVTSIVIGLIAVAVMLMLPRVAAGMSGMVYILMGPAHGINGARYGRARAKLIEARASRES
jgi:uncharacterized membrane protein